MELKSLVVGTRGFDELCRGTFTLSKYLGLFPFKVTKDKIIRRVPILVPALYFVFLAVIFAGIKGEDTIKNVYNIHRSKIATDALVLSYFGLSMEPLVAILWLAYKIKKFAKVVHSLLKIETITSHVPKTNNLLPSLLFIFAQILIQLYGMQLFENYRTTPLIHFCRIFKILAAVSILQFAAVLTWIRSHYAYIVKTVNIENAETWTKVHEFLGSCCQSITSCYSPQIIFYIVSIFIMSVSDVFTVVLVVKTRSHSVTYCMFYLCASAAPCLVIWCVLFNCRDALLQAKAFDKQLYRMVINDDSKTLLRNKRIQVHFKGKHNEEFSAMGFFKLDYPLICSMVCSATTYIVILVQFS